MQAALTAPAAFREIGCSDFAATALVLAGGELQQYCSTDQSRKLPPRNYRSGNAAQTFLKISKTPSVIEGRLGQPAVCCSNSRQLSCDSTAVTACDLLLAYPDSISKPCTFAFNLYVRVSCYSLHVWCVLCFDDSTMLREEGLARSEGWQSGCADQAYRPASRAFSWMPSLKCSTGQPM